MVMSSGGSGFMTGAGPETGTPEPGGEGVTETHMRGGYRIFETKPTTEPAKVEATIRKRERARRVTDRFLQLIDYAFSVLYGLFGLRLVLGLIAANEKAGFVKFLAWLTQPFYAPFVDIVPSPVLTRGKFELPLVVAVWAYLLLHLAIRRLPRILLGAPRST